MIGELYKLTSDLYSSGEFEFMEKQIFMLSKVETMKLSKFLNFHLLHKDKIVMISCSKEQFNEWFKKVKI